MLSGCPDFVGPKLESDLDVRSYAPDAAAWVSDLTIQLRSRGRHRTVPGSSVPDEPFGIHGGSAVTVEVLIQRDVDTLAVGFREFDTNAGYQHGLGVHGGVGGPSDSPWVVCILETHAIPVRTPIPGIPRDSIYVTWSGIPKGAVC
jgi:hypothetical protein